MDLASSKNYYVNGILIASDTSKVIGPTNGGGQGQIDLSNAGTPYALGSAVTSCGAPSFAFTGTGSLKVPNGTTAQRDSSAETGMLRWNTTTGSTEVYDGTAWGNIGGGAIISTTAPSAPNPGDLWYDSDDGRLFVYYNDGTTAQWVDSSPYGLPTDLVVEGNLTVSGTGYIQLPSGTDAHRPGSPAEGMLRWNDTSNEFEGYDGTAWGALGGSSEITTVSNNKFLAINGGGLFAIQKTGGTENIAIFNSDGACEFYHNNNKRIDTTLDGVKITGNLEPEADATRDLGSTTKRWANIYSADLQLSNEGAANEVDGTWGQYTIQEGEDDLFLINRRSGKKYKFNLTEVQ